MMTTLDSENGGHDIRRTVSATDQLSMNFNSEAFREQIEDFIDALPNSTARFRFRDLAAAIFPEAVTKPQTIPVLKRILANLYGTSNIMAVFVLLAPTVERVDELKTMLKREYSKPIWQQLFSSTDMSEPEARLLAQAHLESLALLPHAEQTSAQLDVETQKLWRLKVILSDAMLTAPKQRHVKPKPNFRLDELSAGGTSTKDERIEFNLQYVKKLLPKTIQRQSPGVLRLLAAYLEEPDIRAMQIETAAGVSRATVNRWLAALYTAESRLQRLEKQHVDAQQLSQARRLQSRQTLGEAVPASRRSRLLFDPKTVFDGWSQIVGSSQILTSEDLVFYSQISKVPNKRLASEFYSLTMLRSSEYYGATAVLLRDTETGAMYYLPKTSELMQRLELQSSASGGLFVPAKDLAPFLMPSTRRVGTDAEIIEALNASQRFDRLHVRPARTSKHLSVTVDAATISGEFFLAGSRLVFVPDVSDTQKAFDEHVFKKFSAFPVPYTSQRTTRRFFDTWIRVTRTETGQLVSMHEQLKKTIDANIVHACLNLQLYSYVTKEDVCRVFKLSAEQLDATLRQLFGSKNLDKIRHPMTDAGLLKNLRSCVVDGFVDDRIVQQRTFYTYGEIRTWRARSQRVKMTQQITSPDMTASTQAPSLPPKKVQRPGR